MKVFVQRVLCIFCEHVFVLCESVSVWLSICDFVFLRLCVCVFV